MKPIGNIFGFDCVTCEHNRNCYGGNMGNQFRYCQKSIEKVQNLDKLEQENQKYKEVLDKLKECIKNFLCTEEYINVNGIAIADNYSEVLDILKEVE